MHSYTNANTHKDTHTHTHTHMQTHTHTLTHTQVRKLRECPVYPCGHIDETVLLSDLSS